MFDHYKWRRKQIHNYFLPKSRIERQQAKRKFQVAVAQKDVSSKATKSKLLQLKDTILETVAANPLEDPTRTAVVKREQPAITLPVFAPYETQQFSNERPGEAPTNTGDDFNSRLAQEKTLRESEELTNKDIRNGNDLTMRQLLRIDNRPNGDPLSKYDTEKGDQPDLFG